MRTPADVIESICIEQQRFIMQFQLEPKRLYLGRYERDELLKQAQLFGAPAKGSSGQRMTFRGMPVYEVDQERWLGFGIDCDSPCG
jgi:hypothetical protein